jgi:hypothetical protein
MSQLIDRNARRWWRYNGGLAPQWARAEDIGRRRDDRTAARP